MGAPTAQTQRMSMEDWLERFSEAPFEWLDGEVIPVSPSVYGSNYIASFLRDTMNEVIKAKQLGEVHLELTIVFTDVERWVRNSLIPDIAFISAEKLADFRARHPDDWYKVPLTVIPDLVVEVISPTDRYADVNRKVKRYLDEGVGLVWVVDYLNHFVDVFTTHTTQRLYPSDTLTAGDLIPGFGLKLETLFP